MYKSATVYLLLLLWLSSATGREYAKDTPDVHFPENVTAIFCMSIEEARVTFGRYTNKDVLWSRPKGLLVGNFVGAGSAEKANLYPDKSATYFVINIHWEGTLTLKGRFPNARYVSFTAAKQLGNGQVGNGNYIRGDQIIPDPGSSNPFWSPSLGGSRNVTDRNYTIRILLGDPPENPPNNTLYTGQLSDNGRVHISIRTYLADIDYDGTGNVEMNWGNPEDVRAKHSVLTDVENALPVVSLDTPGNKTLSGPILLKVLDAKKEGDPNGYELGQWLENIDNSKDKINAPCLQIPVSQLFWNNDYSITGAFEAEHPEKRVIEHPPNDDGGFASNPDTSYMVTIYSFGFGEVLVVKGKMPTHPKTRRGETELPEDPQVQYFSVSTAAAPPSGQGYDTACDEMIPLDEDGNYTIVISWPWNRPKNAVIENGIVWLDPGNGEGHYIKARLWVGVLYIRFQHCSPNWKESPQNIPMPTIEHPIPQDPIVMGPYYPRGRYMSTQDFETEFQNNRVITVPSAA